ncbi:unnamed protein product [Closterium sp. NIES-64]|nr:unnamed protein product [Closterium sp. NIES-64]
MAWTGRTGSSPRRAIGMEWPAYNGNFAHSRRRLAPAISARFGSGDDASGPFAKLASLIPTPKSPSTTTRESSSNTKKGKRVTDESTAGEAEKQVDKRAVDASDTGLDGGTSAGRDSGRNELQQHQEQRQQEEERRPGEQGTKRTQQQPKQQQKHQQKQQQHVEGERASTGVRGGSMLEGVRGNGNGGTTGAEGGTNGRLPGNRQKRQQRGGVAAGSSQGGVGAEGQERGSKSGQKEKRLDQASGLGYVDQLRALQAQMQGAESKRAEIKVAELKAAEKQRQQQAAPRESQFEESVEWRRRQGLDAEAPFESTQMRNGSEGNEVEVQGGKAAAEAQQQAAVPVSRAAGERGEPKGRNVRNGVGTSRKMQVQETETRYPWDDPEEQGELGEEEGEIGKGRRVESAESGVGNGGAGRAGDGRSRRREAERREAERREAESGGADRLEGGKEEEVKGDKVQVKKGNGSRVDATGAGAGSKGGRNERREEMGREESGKNHAGHGRKGNENGGGNKDRMGHTGTLGPLPPLGDGSQATRGPSVPFPPWGTALRPHGDPRSPSPPGGRLLGHTGTLGPLPPLGDGSQATRGPSVPFPPWGTALRPHGDPRFHLSVQGPP